MPKLFYRRYFVEDFEECASAKAAAEQALTELEFGTSFPDRIEDDNCNVVWKMESPFTVSDSLEKFINDITPNYRCI